MFEPLDGLARRLSFVIWIVFECLFHEAKSSGEIQLRTIPIAILEVRSIDSNELFHVAALDEVISGCPTPSRYQNTFNDGFLRYLGLLSTLLVVGIDDALLRALLPCCLARCPLRELILGRR